MGSPSFLTAGKVAFQNTARSANTKPLTTSKPHMIWRSRATGTVLMGMAWDGRLSSELLWQRWGGLMGVALTGVWLGHRVAHRVPVARLRQIICGLLVVSGLMLALGALK